MSERIISTKFIFLLYFLISTLLIGAWFSDFRLIATGEEGLQLWNSKQALNLYSSPMIDVGLGLISPVYIPRITFFAFASFLSFFFKPWFYQAIIFWLLLTSGLVGMHLLVGELLSNKDRVVQFFASSFYLLNLYTQSQIWTRFLTTSMFAWAYLPIFLFAWIKWLKEGRVLWLLLLMASSFIFSNTFGMPANIFTFFVPLSIFLIAFTFVRRPFGVKTLVFRIFWGLIVWLITNSWWIYPYFQLAGYSFSELPDMSVSFSSFKGVSQYFPTQEILLLKQSFLFGKESLWFDWYSRGWVMGISILVFIIAVTGWLVSRKEKSWIFLTVLAIAGWFVSKGANSPLGDTFFEWLFSTFPFAAVLRNPYEKFGLVWLLPYSVFFALGLKYINSHFKLRLKEALTAGVFISACGILVWPMWTGKLFRASTKIEAPKYYELANNFITSNSKPQDRILLLPIQLGDGISYKWGYSGIESSEFLFNRTTVSKTFNLSFYHDRKFKELYTSLKNGVNYGEILSQMNIRYIVIRHDVQDAYNGVSIDNYKKIFENNSKIKFLGNFSELAIYEFIPDEGLEIFLAVGDDAPSLDYEKLDYNHYLVMVKGSKGNFNLIFKKIFNDLWEARIGGEKIDEHFLVYDYANGWRVDKEGDYTIDIVFKVWPWD